MNADQESESFLEHPSADFENGGAVLYRADRVVGKLFQSNFSFCVELIMTLGTRSALGVGLGLSFTQHIVVVGVGLLAKVVDRDNRVSWKISLVDVENELPIVNKRVCRELRDVPLEYVKRTVKGCTVPIVRRKCPKRSLLLSALYGLCCSLAKIVYSHSTICAFLPS